MAEIGCGHNVVVPKRGDDVLNAWIILIRRNETLPLKILDRVPRQSRDVQAPESALDTRGEMA